jgi:hypothetical protein
VSRRRHSKKEIENAIRYAELNGWRVEERHGGHAWGRMYCPFNDSECRCGDFCCVSIWSTPRDSTDHANALRRVVNHCIRNKREMENKNAQGGDE